MARPEPFASIDAGIVEALASVDIRCYPFEGTTLPDKLPLATCVMDDGADPGFRAAQQGWRIGKVPYTIRYYTSFDGAMDPDLVWEDAYTGLVNIMNVLGGDLTLGGRVSSITDPRARIVAIRTRDSDRPELMVEIDVTINTGRC